MPFLKEKFGLAHDELFRQIHYLPYYRKYLEVSLQIKLMGREANKENGAERKRILRGELKALWKSLNERWEKVLERFKA